MIHVTHLKRRKWFALADFTGFSVAIFLGYYIRTKIPFPFFQGLLPEGYPQGLQNIWLVLGISGFLYIALQYAFGVYDLCHNSSISNWLQRTLSANIAVALTAFSYFYVTQNFAYSMSLVLVIAFINYFVSGFWRVCYFSMTEVDKSYLAFVGKWIDLKNLLLELEAPPFSNHVRVSAVFVPDQHSEMPPEKDRSFLIKPIGEFDQLSEKNPYTAVLIAPSDAYQQEAFQCLVIAARRGFNIDAVSTIHESLLVRLQHRRINDLPLLELRLTPPFQLNAEDYTFSNMLREQYRILLQSLDFDPELNSNYTGGDSILSKPAVRSCNRSTARRVHGNILVSHFDTCLLEKRRIANQALIFLPYECWQVKLKLTWVHRISEWLNSLNDILDSKRTAEV